MYSDSSKRIMAFYIILIFSDEINTISDIYLISKI